MTSGSSCISNRSDLFHRLGENSNNIAPFAVLDSCRQTDGARVDFIAQITDARYMKNVNLIKIQPRLVWIS